jgi:hypothetical protein
MSRVSTWAVTCPDHNIKRSWTGDIGADPGCPQCKLQGTTPKEPGTELNELCEQALETGRSILSKIEDLPDSADAMEFGSSIEDKVRDIMATIEEKRRCSERQMQALQNMERGVDGWLNRRH